MQVIADLARLKSERTEILAGLMVSNLAFTCMLVIDVQACCAQRCL